jgi:hypothetical protein
MGMIKGAKEYKRFKDGDKLTRKQSMLAMCYDCNGGDESNEDCKGILCPLYEYHPHRDK